MKKTKIKAGVIGATGYAGSELIRLLCRHPQVLLTYAGSHSYAGKRFFDIYPNMQGVCDILLGDDNISEAAELCDVMFLALPAGIASNTLTAQLLEKCVFIDLGADFRLSDAAIYEEWYKIRHGSKDLIGQAVYGLCELYRDKIAHSRLIANPGCYTTCSILSLAPLLKDNLIDSDSIIIDAKSGVSGAGRSEKLSSLYCECNENIKAYGLACHRHTPEIEQSIEMIGGEPSKIIFTPHLAPMPRGIHVTIYGNLKRPMTNEEIYELYVKYYKDEPFVFPHKAGDWPNTKWTVATNHCHLAAAYEPRTQRIIICSVIDNIGKGAAGQAIQNMNIIFGLEETTGLKLAPTFP